MPFTLSHAAAVLPGIRRDGTGRGPLLASALVAGSFAPDLTFYADTVIPGAMEFGQVTHAWWGVLTVDVLITAAAAALWLLLRDPLVALLPTGRQGRVHHWLGGDRRMPRRGPGAVRAAMWFAIAAVVGAGTHVVWDAFTHHDRWGVRLVPVLGRSVAGHPVFQLAQYGTSALALVVLARFVVTGLRSTPDRPAPRTLPVLDRRARWWSVALLALCALLGLVHRCVRWYAYYGHLDTPLDIVPTACFGAGAGLAACLVLYAAGVRLRHRRGPAAAPPGDAPSAAGPVRSSGRADG
ncbi:DUF4184 family protein [Streptomyces sp. NPDC059783]|uniref:DUF4184 family protein n=1 Tax=Streptomyces sp. NPDC059783 TaxID=3346944 RepID=UPI00365C9305